MLSTIIAQAYGLLGRSASVLLAFQVPAQPSGGGGGGASAQAQGGGGGGGAAGGFSQLLIPLLMIGFLYFFMIRPMSKQRKEQEALQKSLQKGDRVVTTSGILGTITGMDEQTITLEISEKVRVKFLRESVTRKFDPNAAQAGAKAATTGAKTTTPPSGSPADAKK